jgi:hypothetical protein
VGILVYMAVVSGGLLLFAGAVYVMLIRPEDKAQAARREREKKKK